MEKLDEKSRNREVKWESRLKVEPEVVCGAELLPENKIHAHELDSWLNILCISVCALWTFEGKINPSAK